MDPDRERSGRWTVPGTPGVGLAALMPDGNEWEARGRITGVR